MFAVQFSKDHNDYIMSDDLLLVKIKRATTNVEATEISFIKNGNH